MEATTNNQAAVVAPHPKALFAVSRGKSLWYRVIPLMVIVIGLIGATVVGYGTTTPLVFAAGEDLRYVYRAFHVAESDQLYTYRWSSGRSQVCAEQYGRAASTARWWLLGQYAVPLGIDEVAFSVNGVPLARTSLHSSPRQYHLIVSEASDRSGDLCLGIETAVVRPSGDPRNLGVPVEALALQRVAGDRLVVPPMIQFGLNLALGLIGVWVLHAFGLSLAVASGIITLPALALGFSLNSGRIIAGASLSRNMLPLVAIGVALIVGHYTTRGWRRRYGSRQLPMLLGGMAFWSIVLVGLTVLMQVLQDRHGVWPLKAGIFPYFPLAAFVPIGCFAVWLALILHQLRREHIPGAVALALVMIGALILPVVLKVSVRGWDSLFYTFRDNPSDYIHDVPRVEHPAAFLQDYIELSSSLTWHSANHPPGSVLFLWGVSRLLGSGAVPATWMVIVLGCMNALAAWWIGHRLGGSKVALVAGAILVVMPAYEIYNVTSMDTIFSATIALAAVALVLSVQPGASPWAAVTTGILAALGLFFTYAATQLFWFGLGLGCLTLLRYRQPVPLLRQATIAVATLAALFLMLDLTTGFNIVEGALQATANNSRMVTRTVVAHEAQFLAPPSLAYYTYYLGVNIVPYAWYLAPWGLALIAPAVTAAWGELPHPSRQSTLALSLMTLILGMWLSGLFIREVERIWAFTYPLAAFLIAARIWQVETQREQLWRTGLIITLFFAQSTIMRMLLNTYW